MSNWKNIVSKANARQYRWPIGWRTREQVAEDLECPRDKVAEILAPAIEQGLIERKSFPVWDEISNRRVMVVGYRELKPRERRAKTSYSCSADGLEIQEGTKVVRRDGHGDIGILSRDGKRWRVDWPHRSPTYPSAHALKYRLRIVE